MDCVEEQMLTKELDHTCRHYTNTLNESKADSEKSELCLKNTSVKNEIQKLIPEDSFFHMISMPKNWEQVQRLKNRKLELDKDIFSRKSSVSEKTNDFEESKDSDDEIIDVENISVHDMNTDCSLKSSGDCSDAESDNSLVCLQIVEVEDAKDDDEDESKDMQETSSQLKNSQECVGMKTKSKSANDNLNNVFEDKASDLCKLTAAGINNSLFDTIASLQQSMEPNKIEKQASLEYIVSHIKSEAEVMNEETADHIPNPVASELQTDDDSRKPEREAGMSLDTELDSLSVDTTTENKQFAPKKRWRVSKNSGEKHSQRCDGKDLTDQVNLQLKKHLYETNNDNNNADSGTLIDGHTKTNEKFPVKLKIKKYLKMQQKLAKREHGQLRNDEKEVPLVQNDSAESMAKCVKTNSSEGTMNEKGMNGGNVQESSNVAGKNIKETLENSQSSDDLSLYKLKYECIQNQMKLLKYESKLLGLKEKLLEKKSMQHYFKTLVDNCYSKNQAEQNKDGRLINKWDSMKKTKTFAENERKCFETRPKSACTEHNLKISTTCENVADKFVFTESKNVSNNAKQKAEDMDMINSVYMKKKRAQKGSGNVLNDNLDSVTSEKKQQERTHLKQSEKVLPNIRTQVSGKIDTHLTGLNVSPATSQETKQPFVPIVPPSHTPLSSAHLNNQGCVRGYQIPRPTLSYNVPGNFKIRSGAVGYAPISLTTTKAATQGSTPPLHIVQVPPTGRLYAVVNNVLQPIVQNVNGQYLPVINSSLPNKTLPKGYSVQNQTFLPCSTRDPKSKVPLIVLSSSAAYIQTSQQSLMSSCQMRNSGMSTVSYTKPLIHSQLSENGTSAPKRQEDGMAFLSQTPIISPSCITESNTKAITTVSQIAGNIHIPRQNTFGIACNQKSISNSNILARTIESKCISGTDMNKMTEKPSVTISQQFLKNKETSTDKKSNDTCSTPEANCTVDLNPKSFSDPAKNQTGEILKLALSKPLETNYKLACDNTQKASQDRSDMAEKSTKETNGYLETSIKERSQSLFSVKQEVGYEQQDLCNRSVLKEKGSYESILTDQLDKSKQRSSPATSPVHIDSDDSFDSIDWNRYESTRTDLISVRSESAEKSGNLSNSYGEKKTVTLKFGDKEAKQEASCEKIHTSCLPGFPNPALRKNTSHKCIDFPSSKSSGKGQKKRFVKTKFIILKGDICDRWLAIKNKTGYEGMSDPSFVHYLLKLEEMRQTQLARMRKYHNKNMPRVSKASENSCNDKDHDCLWQIPLTECSQNSQRTEVHEVDDGADRSILLIETSSNSSALQSTSSSVTDGSEGQLDSLAKNVGSQDVAFKHCSAKRKIDLGNDSSGKVSNKRGRFEFLSNSTKRQMSWAVSVFIEWLKESGEDCPSVSSKDACWLDEKLRLFYVKAKTLCGSPYPSTILQTFRRALSLWLSMYSSSASIKVGISLDAAYQSSNKLLSIIMRTEEENRNSIQPVSNTDLDKLYSTQTFSDKSPENLLWKVWFDIVRHLCRPKMPKHLMGYLNKQNLSLESDVDGVYFCFEDLGYLPDCESGRMYATPSEPEKCPVRTTSLYLSRLNENCSSLFQCPNKDMSSSSKQWYVAMPISNDQLISLMESISSHGGLSTVYTIANVMATSK